jgi:hypothetical protein
MEIPEGVTRIGIGVFSWCDSIRSITLPDSLREIGYYAFSGCKSLHAIEIPAGVRWIGDGAFMSCSTVTVVCREGSRAHEFCGKEKLSFIFDYQFEAFHGVLPPGFEKRASPFLADEEKPFVFISYSHRDREEVLQYVTPLYEAGWRIWYDEGLTIGDRYDETLEAHVKNSAAVLLFETEHAVKSRYIRERELPWAAEAGRPVIRCVLQEGLAEQTAKGAAATVSPGEIEAALKKVKGLTRGGQRTAKGVSVLCNPADRVEAEGGFAYCVYSGGSAAAARAVLLEAKNNGCSLYDAVERGKDAGKLETCACLVVLLDRDFLADRRLTELLRSAFLAGRDIAVCQIGAVSREDLPSDLADLRSRQWLNYASGITTDLNTQLARHLQKLGCRDAAVLPGFSYETTKDGIVITQYAGMEASPRIEAAYGGLPVVKIAAHAFENRVHLKTVELPGSVTEIGERAFFGCTELTSVTFPKSLTALGKEAFSGCKSLTAAALPKGLTEIPDRVFQDCESLSFVRIPDHVTQIGKEAFRDCRSLASVKLPAGVQIIGYLAFGGCRSLTALTLPHSETEIGTFAFSGCKSLASVTIPRGVRAIRHQAFSGCDSLTTVTMLDDYTFIEDWAFLHCPLLTLRGNEHSAADSYAAGASIRFQALKNGEAKRLRKEYRKRNKKR